MIGLLMKFLPFQLKFIFYECLTNIHSKDELSDSSKKKYPVGELPKIFSNGFSSPDN